MLAPRKTLLHLSPLADVGGCEVNCLRVIEGLGDCDHHVAVFDGPGPMSAKWNSAGARVEHLSAWQSGGRKFHSVLASWAKSRARPEGIFLWSTSRLAAVIRAVGHWETPIVVYLGNPVTSGFIPKMRQWMLERLKPRAPPITLVACSNHVAASYRQATYFRGLKTVVVYNAVVSDFDFPRAHRSLPTGSGPRIGMVARLDTIKDHITILRAAALVVSSRPDIMVEFAGDGSLRHSLEREARRLGVSKNVRFLGFTETLPVLKTWDIYVHSTTADEGMGTAVAEAMMTGLPCVVSDLAVMREVCGTGAVFVPPANAPAMAGALAQLIDNPSLRRSLGRRAQARARRMFSLDTVTGAYLQMISSKGGTR